MTTLVKIKQSELSELASTSCSGALLDEALRRCIDKPARLVELIALYVTFNAPFVSGAAMLSGAISARPDLFRDSSAPFLLADKAVEVARRVHDAIVDEFLDRTENVSHRTLAQGFVKLMASYAKYDIVKLGDVVTRNRLLSALIQDVPMGYGRGDISSDSIFFGLGWHMGSEFLADDEFNRIETFLNLHFADLVRYMKETKVTVGTMECTGYFWMEIHTSVEKDHFGLAYEAAQMAIDNYAGEKGVAHVKNQILKGFSAFVETQKDVLEVLANF